MSRKSRAAWEARLVRTAPTEARNAQAAKAKGRPLVPARPTIYNGVRYPSAHEARVAEQLDWLLRAGLLAGVERQYAIELLPYNALGEAVTALRRRHRVDFRAHHHDGSFTLVEAKGYETPAYVALAKWIRHFWLPLHQDHDYVVIYCGDSINGNILLKSKSGKGP